MSTAEKIFNQKFDFFTIENDRFELYREQRDQVQNTFAADVQTGLSADQKWLSPKYFYDDHGSRLFEKITKTPEYYPTRKETSILRKNAAGICNRCENVITIVELGSGSAIKTKIILDAFLAEKDFIRYVPIDVSDILIVSSKDLLTEYARLSVTGIISEYENGLDLIESIDESAKLILFLGSSIGNMDHGEAMEFLQRIADSMLTQDFLLVGFDMVKRPNILNAAYNDLTGYTESFNLNILHRINRELNANFDVVKFEHRAFYNEKFHRIEMHLAAREDQEIMIKELDTTFSFSAGETIHTENSHKFTPEMITTFAKNCGLKILQTWQDPQKYYSLTLFALS